MSNTSDTAGQHEYVGHYGNQKSSLTLPSWNHSGLLFTPEPYVYHVVSPVDSNGCTETNVILLYPPLLTHNRLNGGRDRVTFEDSEMLSNVRQKIPSTRISVSLFLKSEKHHRLTSTPDSSPYDDRGES